MNIFSVIYLYLSKWILMKQDFKRAQEIVDRIRAFVPVENLPNIHASRKSWLFWHGQLRAANLS